MKNLNLKLLLNVFWVLLFANSARSACNASFTKSISGLTVTFNNTSTTTSGFPAMMTYYWSFGDGTYSNLKNPVKTYSSGGVKGIQLFINDSFGCTHTAIDTFILVAPTPTCNASFAKSGSGWRIFLFNTSTSSSGNQALKYNWYFSDSSTSNLKDPIKLFTSGGKQFARLTIFDTVTSCTSTTIDTFLLSNSACIANFTKSMSGKIVTLNNTSLNAVGTQTGLTYLWQFSDGTSSTSINLVKTFATGGFKTIRLTIQDSANSCTSTKIDTVFLTTNSLCTALFSKSIGGLTVNLTNSSLNSLAMPTNLNYLWQISDGTTYTTRNLTKTFATGGTKIIRLTIQDTAYNCTSTAIDTINLVTPPVCYAYFDVILPGGLNVLFNTFTYSNTASTSLKYTWQFSDGTYSNLVQPTKTFPSIGMHWAKLTLLDTISFCTSQHTVSFVLLLGPPTCSANFTKKIISGSAWPFEFTNESYTSSLSKALKYTWSFSDSTSSNLKDPLKVFTGTGGQVWAKLTMLDSITNCTSTVIDTFTLTPTSSCLAQFSKRVTGNTVTLSNYSVNKLGNSDGLDYEWQFSDSTYSNERDPRKTFFSGGWKTIRLTITDSANSCTSTRIDTIFIYTINCSAAFTRLDSGLTCRFYNLSSPMKYVTRFFWEFSDSTNTYDRLPIKTFSSYGTKWARLTMFDSSTLCSATYIDTFDLVPNNTNCIANFTKSITPGNMTVNLNNSSLNGNGGTSGLAYTWSFSQGANSYVKNPSRTFTIPGVNWVRLTIFDSITNCTSSKIDSFVLVPSSSCQASFNKTISGLTVTLNNTSTNLGGLPAGLFYTWDFSDGTSSNLKNPVKTFTSGGVKTIQLSITDSAKTCTATAFDTLLLVAPTPLCSARFSLAIDTTTPFNFFLLNTSLVRPTSTFYWTFGDGGSSTSMTPTHSYATFGKYLVCLTVSDSICTSTYCDSIGMDSTGRLLKSGGFSFRTLDFTTLTGTTGLASMTEPMEYHIYPNPSVGEVSIELTMKEATPLSFEITDVSGKLLAIKSVPLASDRYKESFDLSELKPSIYFLSIRSNAGVSTFKLIKN